MEKLKNHLLRPFPTFFVSFLLMILIPFFIHQLHGNHKVTFITIAAVSFLLQGGVSSFHGVPFLMALISPAVCTLLLYFEWPDKSQQLGNWNVQLAIHMILWYIPSFVLNAFASIYVLRSRISPDNVR